MFPIHTILHPTDFSDRAGYAFRVACALARAGGARLVILHVAQPLWTLGGIQGVPPVPLEYGREGLEELLRRLQPPDPAVAVEHRLELGDPAAEILRAARECSCDLIVMGTHGRGGLGRLLMGSVAEAVVRQAPCPVLTVRLPLPAPAPVAGPPAREPAPAN
jgi:nucleotide-binding universal stress UspA family protein